jgi:uncharacterized DUF497 family protein
MNIIWDADKEAKLMTERGISMAEIAAIIDRGEYICAIDNPARIGQRIFVIRYKDYTYAVPYILDAEERFVLKTAYASRKYHKLYGGKNG